MDESFESYSSNYDQLQVGSYNGLSNRQSSGLTLVLPPLKDGKPLRKPKQKQKRTSASHAFYEPFPGEDTSMVVVNRAPRPLKLKPLKEVLTKLISQIKK